MKLKFLLKNFTLSRSKLIWRKIILRGSKFRIFPHRRVQTKMILFTSIKKSISWYFRTVWKFHNCSVTQIFRRKINVWQVLILRFYLFYVFCYPYFVGINFSRMKKFNKCHFCNFWGSEFFHFGICQPSEQKFQKNQKSKPLDVFNWQFFDLYI